MKTSRKIICLALATLMMTVILVGCGGKSDKLSRFDGKVVGYLAGSEYDEIAKEAIGQKVVLKEFSSSDEMTNALEKGEIDAFLMEKSASSLIKVPEFKMMSQNARDYSYAFAFPKSDVVKAAINADMKNYIVELKKSGELDKMIEKWTNNADNAKKASISVLNDENGTISMAVSTEIGEPLVTKYGSHYVGLEIEIARGFCEKYGYALDFAEMDIDDIAEAVRTGDVTFAAVTPEIIDELGDDAIYCEGFYDGGISVTYYAGSGNRTTVENQDEIAGKSSSNGVLWAVLITIIAVLSAGCYFVRMGKIDPKKFVNSIMAKIPKKGVEVAEKPAEVAEKADEIPQKTDAETVKTTVDVNVKSGETIGFIGEFGEILKVIAGKTKSASKEVVLNGMNGVSPEKIVYVGAKSMPCCCAKLGWIVGKNGDTILDQLDLGDYADRFVCRLSKGQKRRVMLARALAKNPEILVLDGLFDDLGTRDAGEVKSAIRTIKGVTVFIGSDDVRFIREISDRTAFIDKGMVVEQGKTEKIFTDPSEDATYHYIWRIRTHEIHIASKRFDFIGATAEIEEYGYNNRMANGLTQKACEVFNGLVRDLIVPKEFGKLHAIIECGEDEITMQILFGGKAFDPSKAESYGKLRRLLSGYEYESIDEDGYTNYIKIRLA